MGDPIRTGTWTATFADGGDVTDLRSLDLAASLPGGDEHRVKVIRRVNEDRNAGIAPPIERWGVEYREEHGRGDSYHWLSYLSLTWHSLYDGTPEAERRAKMARLDGVLDDMLALGDAARHRIGTRLPYRVAAMVLRRMLALAAKRAASPGEASGAPSPSSPRPLAPARRLRELRDANVHHVRRLLRLPPEHQGDATRHHDHMDRHLRRLVPRSRAGAR